MFDSASPEDHRLDLGGPDVAAESWWRRERIELLGWLENSAPALAPLYRGALALAMLDSFPGRVHFIAHAIRETRNRLQYVVVTFSDRGPVPRYVVENWKRLYSDVHKFAHVGDEPLPAEADGEWVAKFFAFEQILMALSKRSYENLDDLDSLLERANTR